MINKSKTIHVDDEVFRRLESIRLELKALKGKDKQARYTGYNEVIKRLINFRENRNVNDI
jgi:predicted CopG family antitoxin